MSLAPLLLSQLFLQCAPDVAPETLMPLVAVESAAKPFVVANVTDNTSHFFDEKERAVAFVNTLAAQGKNYSAGLMQINAKNFAWLGLTNETVFDHCANIRAGAKVLQSCYARAAKNETSEQTALRHALSCYYSGNFQRGYAKEKTDGKSYIERIETKALAGKPAVPALKTARADGPVTPAKKTSRNPKKTEAVIYPGYLVRGEVTVSQQREDFKYE